MNIPKPTVYSFSISLLSWTRQLVLCVVCIQLFALTATAQVGASADSSLAYELSTSLDADFGFIQFENSDGDKDSFLSSVFAPTFEYGPWTGGLRLLLRMNSDGRRSQDYDEFTDYLNILRFLQYSEDEDPGYYGRVGDMDRTDIGYGQFIHRYRNTVRLDSPRLGGKGSYRNEDKEFEGLLSDLAGPEVIGMRGAYRPFLRKEDVWYQHVLLGLTFAADISEEAKFVDKFESGLPFFVGDVPEEADSLGLGAAQNAGSLWMFGLDAGIPVLTTENNELYAYTELGKIGEHGSGFGVGLKATKRFANGRRVTTWVAQRVLGKEYVPSFFNSMYEVNRIREKTISLDDGTELKGVNTKRNLLHQRDKVELGSYVSMAFRYGRGYRIRWSYEHSWNRSGSGWFQVDLLINNLDLPYRLRFGFDRINMTGLGDVFSGASDDGLLRVEFAYMVIPHLLVGFRFRQSFEEVEQDGRQTGLKKNNRIFPGFVVHL